MSAPGITYYNDVEQRLEFALLGPDGWSVEAVDAEGDAGRYSALAYDANGNPHIAYFVASSRESGTIRYATWDGSGWQIEDVDNPENVRMGHVGARKITSLVIGSDGVTHLAYSDQGRMVYARKSGDSWMMVVVDTGGVQPLGQLVELLLDSDGNPHLIWFQPAGKVMFTSGS